MQNKEIVIATMVWMGGMPPGAQHIVVREVRWRNEAEITMFECAHAIFGGLVRVGTRHDLFSVACSAFEDLLCAEEYIATVNEPKPDGRCRLCGSILTTCGWCSQDGQHPQS